MNLIEISEQIRLLLIAMETGAAKSLLAGVEIRAPHPAPLVAAYYAFVISPYLGREAAVLFC